MKIKIKVEGLPLHFLILAGFLILYSVFHLITWQYMILNSALFIVGVLMLTSHQALLIDTGIKKYSEYYWVLGMKLSNYSEHYEKITSLECIKSNYSQEYGKYNRRFISGTMYKGYIELSNRDNLFLGQNKSKHSMIRKLTKLSAKFDVPVHDRTNEENI